MIIKGQTPALAGASGENAATMPAEWRSTSSSCFDKALTIEKRDNPCINLHQRKCDCHYAVMCERYIARHGSHPLAPRGRRPGQE